MATYTHGHDESVLRAHRWRTAENSAGYLLPHLRPGLDLLDVGCGPGTVTVDLAKRVAPGRVVGLDLTEAPLPGARALPGGAAVEFAVGDAMALPYEDGSFDVVHAHQVLQHLADPVGALREMARVARQGGLVAVRDADYKAHAWWPRLRRLDDWLRVYRATARSNGAQPDAGRRLLGWAQTAGLSDLTPGASTWCFATPEDRAWWGGTWAERCVASDFAAQAVAQGHASPAELEAVATAFRRWAAAPDAWWVVLHGELLARV